MRVCECGWGQEARRVWQAIAGKLARGVAGNSSRQAKQACKQEEGAGTKPSKAGTCSMQGSMVDMMKWE